MKNLERNISYQFKNKKILDRAFTHSSYINECGDESLKDYERLEFLGDSVLQLAISDILFDEFPNKKEGVLTKMRSKIVREDSLYLIAKKLNLGEYIKFSKGEIKTGGRNRKSILADVVESLIAAIYLDSSYESAKLVISKLFKNTIMDLANSNDIEDYKSLLQIYIQSTGEKNTPTYKILESSGPEHCKEFTCGVYINDKLISTGSGKSKRLAEQLAAKKAYHSLCDNK